MLVRGIDLLDLFRGRMSWRRFKVILGHLPPESAYVTAVREAMSPDELAALSAQVDPDRHGPWSKLEMLMAAVRDEVARLAWMQSDGSTPVPDPYPRPGVKRRGVTAINPAAEAYLREVERLHGAQPAPDWKPPA